MAEDSLYQDKIEENPKVESQCFFNNNNNIPTPYKDFFFLGTVMCELIEVLYASIRVIPGPTPMFIGDQSTDRAIVSLLKLQEKWKEATRNFGKQIT